MAMIIEHSCCRLEAEVERLRVRGFWHLTERGFNRERRRTAQAVAALLQDVHVRS